jgi:hypothetical protein
MVWFRLHPGSSAGISPRLITGNLCATSRDLLAGQKLAPQPLDHDPGLLFGGKPPSRLAPDLPNCLLGRGLLLDGFPLLSEPGTLP